MSFAIKNPPEFTIDIPKWDRDTFADGAEMSKVPEALLNNEVYLKERIEELEGKVLTDVKISASGWNGQIYEIADLVITTDSDIELYFGFDSIPAAQKANIRGRCEVGKLVLVAAKLPTVDLVIEKIRIVNLEQRGD